MNFISLIHSFVVSACPNQEKIDALNNTMASLKTENNSISAENRNLNIRIAKLLEIVIPVTDLTMISRADYLAKMKEAGISPISLTTPLDSTLSITTKAELDRIAPYLVYPAELYVAQIWDCENYGLQAMLDAARKFHASGITLGLGNMPLGYHGFALTMDNDYNIYWLESNAGFEYAGVWYKIGEEGYLPDKVFV